MADAAGQSFEEPHMRAGRCQLDVSQALTAYFGKSDFHAAFVADHSAMLHALVLAAETLPIGYRSEDASAKQPIALRFKSAVINSFRFGYFAVRPAPYLFRRGQADSDCVEVGDRVCQIKGARTKQGVPPLPAAMRCRGRLLNDSLSGDRSRQRILLNSQPQEPRPRVSLS